MFLWISHRHIVEIDLRLLEAVSVIEMESTEYNDFKNDIYTFIMKTSLDNNGIDIFVQNAKGIIHYEQFIFPINNLKIKRMASGKRSAIGA